MEEKTEIAWLTLLSGNGGFGVGFLMFNPRSYMQARSLLCLYIGKAGITGSLLFINFAIY